VRLVAPGRKHRHRRYARVVTRNHRRFIGYPTDRMLAVLPDGSTLEPVVTAFREIGIPEGDITVLRGPDGADRLDGTGASHGILTRIHRLVSFTMMDQLVDMAMYERAVLDGAIVVMVRVRGNERKAAVLDAIRRHGGHFANYYGRFATEELVRWHGPEPRIHDILRR
jgi:hypothetical protein